MNFITKKTMPIVFFIAGLILSLLSVVVIAVLRAMGLTDMSVLASTTVFGAVAIITIVWYLFLFATGQLKSEKSQGGYADVSSSSFDSDSDWE